MKLRTIAPTVRQIANGKRASGKAMKRSTLYLAALASTTVLTVPMARADTEAPMSDCSDIHEIILDLAPDQLVSMCQTAMRTMGLFGGPKLSDFNHLADYTEAMSKVAGYKRGQYDQIISEVAQIIKLRGQAQKPDRWPYTADLVFKMYNDSNAAITPTDFIEVLSGAGPLAETVSDDGLPRLILVYKHNRDNDWERK
jgi:hypothetical protein